jgi:hypothetical protein
MTLIPNFERLTGIVLDHLQRLVDSNPTELSLDVDRIVVIDASRVVTHCANPRVNVCVFVKLFYSLREAAMTRTPGWYANLC